MGSVSNELNGQEILDSPDGLARSTLLTRAGQALVTGKYRKARPYSVEALILYAQCKYYQKEEPDNVREFIAPTPPCLIDQARPKRRYLKWSSRIVFRGSQFPQTETF